MLGVQIARISPEMQNRPHVCGTWRGDEEIYCHEISHITVIFDSNFAALYKNAVNRVVKVADSSKVKIFFFGKVQVHTRCLRNYFSHSLNSATSNCSHPHQKLERKHKRQYGRAFCDEKRTFLSSFTKNKYCLSVIVQCFQQLMLKVKPVLYDD